MLWLPALWVGSLGLSGDSCVVKADCEKGLDCIKGTCVARKQGAPAGADCTRSADCAEPLRCRARVCTDPVARSAPSQRAPTQIPQNPPAPQYQPSPQYQAAPQQQPYPPDPAQRTFVAPPRAAPGWAFAGAILGFASMVPIAALAIASEATKAHRLPAIPIGATATVLVASIAPVVAVAGSSAREPFRDQVRGILALRVLGWISYGAVLAQATVLIATGAATITPPDGLIVSTGLVGLGALALFAADALVSRGQAQQRVQQGAQTPTAGRVQLVPVISAARTGNHRIEPTLGLAGTF